MLKVGRPRFDSLVESDQNTLKVGFTTSLLDVQHKKGVLSRQAGKFTCCVLWQGT